MYCYSELYVDECGVDEEYHREYGWAEIGVRVHDTKSGKKGKRTNVVAGLWGNTHVAVQCHGQAIRSMIFEDWFEHELIPTIPYASLVILDNASWPRKKHLYSLAEKHGILLLFLPKYSPDFNRIEKSWANFNLWLADNFFRFPSLDFALLCFFYS